jgi:sugar lactone lactonase YvrE
MMKAPLVVVFLVTLSLALPMAVHSQDGELATVETVVAFNPEAGELPEGIAVDAQGNVYVALSPLGQIRKIAPDGTETLFASLPSPGETGAGLLGMAFDAGGILYAGLGTEDPSTTGIYRVSPDGSFEHLAGSEAITFPNYPVFDDAGNLYVSDTIIGAIWKIPPGGAPEPWIQHEMLTGMNLPDVPMPFPVGANGLAYKDGNLYAAVTEQFHVLRISVQADGSAGSPEVIAGGEELAVLDGIALDENGDIYALVISQSKLVRIDHKDGTVTTLATAAEGLDFPASLAFGTQAVDNQTVYVTNFAIGPPGGAGPGVVKVDVGVRGLPLPYGAPPVAAEAVEEVAPEVVPETGGAGIPVYLVAIALGGVVVFSGLAEGLLRRRSR